jgi:hypothetical protein
MGGSWFRKKKARTAIMIIMTMTIQVALDPEGRTTGAQERPWKLTMTVRRVRWRATMTIILDTICQPQMNLCFQKIPLREAREKL